MKQERNLTADEKEEIESRLVEMSQARLVFTGEGFKATFNGAFLALEKDPKWGDLVVYNPWRENHVFAVSGAELRRILKLDVDACTGIELVYSEGERKRTREMTRKDAIAWMGRLLEYAGRVKEKDILFNYMIKLNTVQMYSVNMEAVN